MAGDPASLADALAREDLAALAGRGLLRTLSPSDAPPGPFVSLGGERLVNFSANDYLGLAGDPRVARALSDGALRWGAGAGASRLVTGDYLPQHALEAALARFEGTEAALLFNSGYAANCGLLPSFAGPGDLLLSDALNHASLIDGCRLSRARVEVYPHADAEAVDALLARLPGRRKLVVTDSIFSMDGDAAPLSALRRACERHGALLVLDEAHATGVLGPHGQGLAHALGVRADLRMATLSKAVGVAGAHVAGSRAVCDLLLNRARPLIYSTALPPALACAALASLSILAGPEGDERRARLRTLGQRLAAGLRGLGLPATEDSPIFPVVLGEPARALEVASRLRARGFLVKAIRPPTVPEGTSRLRIALSAAHSEGQVDGLLAALAEAA